MDNVDVGKPHSKIEWESVEMKNKRDARMSYLRVDVPVLTLRHWQRLGEGAFPQPLEKTVEDAEVATTEVVEEDEEEEEEEELDISGPMRDNTV